VFLVESKYKLQLGKGGRGLDIGFGAECGIWVQNYRSKI
jgi:hypothetical protein